MNAHMFHVRDAERYGIEKAIVIHNMELGAQRPQPPGEEEFKPDHMVKFLAQELTYFGSTYKKRKRKIARLIRWLDRHGK